MQRRKVVENYFIIIYFFLSKDRKQFFISIVLDFENLNRNIFGYFVNQIYGIYSPKKIKTY